MDQIERIAEFIYACPEGFPNLVDLPYRLSSWALDDPANYHIWEADGQVQAVGLIQLPWLALDYALRPGSESLVAAILDWAAARAGIIARTTQQELPLVVRIPPNRAAHIPHLAARGFQLDDDWTIVHLNRALHGTLTTPALPDGYRFRALRGESEVAAYVDLHQTAFGSKNMRTGWRSRTLTMPQYRPELDLLVVDADDRPVAFCIGWLHPDQPIGQIEPLGVHPASQRLGLGRAVLLEGLRRLQVAGAQTARIDSYKHNDPALSLYQMPENGDFRVEYEAVGYVRVFTPTPS